MQPSFCISLNNEKHQVKRHLQLAASAAALLLMKVDPPGYLPLGSYRVVQRPVAVKEAAPKSRQSDNAGTNCKYIV